MLQHMFWSLQRAGFTPFFGQVCLIDIRVTLHIGLEVSAWCRGVYRRQGVPTKNFPKVHCLTTRAPAGFAGSNAGRIRVVSWYPIELNSFSIEARWFWFFQSKDPKADRWNGRINRPA